MASPVNLPEMVPVLDLSASDLAKKITFKSMEVSNLRFENQTNEATVSAESNIYARLTLKIQPKGQFNSLRQIVVGVKEVGPQELIFSERKIIGKRLEGYMSVDQNMKVYETYTEYDKTFKIQAPSKPGLYELEICLLELDGEPIQNPGLINGFFKINDFEKEILESNNALDYLWNFSERNCKISLGLIRVI